MGAFIFPGVSCRLTLLLALEESSADCLRKSGCIFAYVYGFSVNVRLFRTLCTAFLHIVWLLSIYTDFPFTMFNVDILKETDLEGSVDFFCLHAVQCGNSRGVRS